MAAPKDNTYGLDDQRSGRPPRFATPELLREQVNGYFQGVGNELPTVTGLALFLGFSSRQSLYDYARREAFSYTIKRALLLIEASYEGMLTGPNSHNAIFALKAMGWSNKVVRSTSVVTKKPRLIDE